MTLQAVHWLPTLAATCHFLQLPSMTWVKRELKWDQELRQLSAFSRALVLLFGAGIITCIAGLGLVVIFSHGALLHSASGRALCLFLGLFWLARAIVQYTWLGPHWPASLRWMHRGLAVLYPGLGLAYGAAWLLSR